jgi:hypothetical protein
MHDRSPDAATWLRWWRHGRNTVGFHGLDVRYWHEADIDPLTKDVLFQVQSEHQVKAHRCLEMTQTGHKDLFDHFVSAGEDLRR